jgi:hypothetical protein
VSSPLESATEGKVCLREASQSHTAQDLEWKRRRFESVTVASKSLKRYGLIQSGISGAALQKLISQQPARNWKWESTVKSENCRALKRGSCQPGAIGFI